MSKTYNEEQKGFIQAATLAAMAGLSTGQAGSHNLAPRAVEAAVKALEEVEKVVGTLGEHNG